MKPNQIKSLRLADAGRQEVLQGNIAFAVGCVRGGIHGVDGYPGTPSTEVIDRGLSQVQDLINVGWSVNEAVALSVGIGHTLAGHDAVATKDFDIIEVDILGAALKNGDTSGRSANVVMMGALSKTPAFSAIPEAQWLKAVKNVSPTPPFGRRTIKRLQKGGP